jgi:quercetin dioxygenase-like cupin family protein
MRRVSKIDLLHHLQDLGFEASGWVNGPGERYAAHAHAYDKVIAVERGSIRFGLPGSNEAVELIEGDRLDLPAGTTHDALVGPAGVSCLESHPPAGSLPGVARRAAGTW